MDVKTIIFTKLMDSTPKKLVSDFRAPNCKLVYTKQKRAIQLCILHGSFFEYNARDIPGQCYLLF